MLLETFNDKFEYQRLSKDEMESRGILGRLVGVIADTKNPTRNGRKYSAELWERTFNDPILEEKIKNRCLFGELGHPEDRSEIDIRKVAICLAEIPKKGKDGKIYGIFDILNTECGKLLKTLCDYGCRIGISSRGEGELITNYDGDDEVDPESYTCECWDAVLVPGIKEARLTYVTESLNKKRYNKTLKESIQKVIDESDETNREVIKESLDTLGISLNEPDNSGVNITEEQESSEDKMKLSELVTILDSHFKDGTLSQFIKDNNFDTDLLLKAVKKSDIIKYQDLRNVLIEKLDEAYMATDYDYIEQALNREGIKFDYNGYDDSYKFDCNDFNQADEIICNIVGDRYHTDRDNCIVYIDDEELTESINEGNYQPDDNTENGVDVRTAIIRLANKVKLGGVLDDTEEKLYDALCNIVTNKDDIQDESLNINEDANSINKASQELRDYLLNWYNNNLSSETVEEVEKSAWTDELQELWLTLVNYLPIKKDDNQPDMDDINEAQNTAVDNNEAIVEELQTALQNNAELENKVIQLQEKLSVCYAKESENEGKIAKYQKAIGVLSSKSNEVNVLQSRLVESENKLKSTECKLSELVTDTQSKNAKIKMLETKLTTMNESLNKSADSRKTLNEQFNQSTTRIQKLTEALDKVTQEKAQIESKFNDKIKALNESNISLKKDLQSEKSQYASKLDKSNKLVEKYQSIAKSAVDKYISLQATNLGIRSDEIKSRLPESYNFNDIDTICEDLRSYSLSMSKLPFQTNNIRVKMKPSKNESLPLSDDSDFVDDSLLVMAKLK